MVASKYFNLGQIVATHKINNEIANSLRFALEVGLCLKRYAVKDWGELDEEDKQTNEDALNYPDDLYILASYKTSKGTIWIITNRATEKAGDNVTTVLFPDER